jgi:hypothetical protein
LLPWRQAIWDEPRLDDPAILEPIDPDLSKGDLSACRGDRSGRKTQRSGVCPRTKPATDDSIALGKLIFQRRRQNWDGRP